MIGVSGQGGAGPCSPNVQGRAIHDIAEVPGAL